MSRPQARVTLIAFWPRAAADKNIETLTMAAHLVRRFTRMSLVLAGSIRTWLHTRVAIISVERSQAIERGCAPRPGRVDIARMEMALGPHTASQSQCHAGLRIGILLIDFHLP